MATMNLYVIIERRGPAVAVVSGCSAEDALHVAALDPDLAGWQLNNTHTRMVQKNINEPAARVIALLLRLTRSRAEEGLPPADELGGLRQELALARDIIASFEVRVRADDAALEYAVDARARAAEERTRVMKALDQEHMAWHDEHEHAIDFACDILDTAPLAQQTAGDHDGQRWLLLSTTAQNNAAQHLARVGHVEIHANKTWARYVPQKERVKTSHDYQHDTAGTSG